MLRTILLSSSLVILLVVAAVFGIRAVSERTAESEASGNDIETQKLVSSPARLTIGDRRIEVAERMIKQAGTKPEGYNLLCAAYMQKFRETGDADYNARAEAALNRSLEVAPDNYDALKLRPKLLLSFHRFGEALEAARRAQALRPDDHDVYGALTDAHVELGNYDEAIAAAQKMVDLRPDAAAYARISYLRALHGDTEGAIEAMTVAAKAADPRDPESVAWHRLQLGNELMNSGKRDAAEREFDNALRVFPDYHLAIESKARARVAAGDLDSAIRIYEREQEGGPSADAALALGDLYTRKGRAGEAKKQYELFESLERENAAKENDWHHLVYYWADHDKNLDEALRLAMKEREARKDIFTCDALAWVLFKKGRHAEAKAAMDEALRLGSHNALLFYHAGMIANALGERRDAAKYLQLAHEVNPSFDILQADIARRTLETIGSNS